MAMDNKIQIEVVTKNMKQAISEFEQMTKAIKGTNTQVKSLRLGETSNTLKTITKEGNKLLRTTQTFAKDGSLKSISTSVSNANHSFSGLLRSISRLGASIVIIRGVGSSMFKFAEYSIDYSESLNLFNVVFDNIYENGTTTFSKLGLEATKFQTKLEQNFGANPTESLTYQALFQSMATSQGIAGQYAYIMSENSTKLVYDLSSLFNKEQEDVVEALRAGIYAGQTKPLRTYGIDITETSLQATLEQMAQTNSALENLTVSTMSQAEKQLLRYLTVLQQTTVAQGDFANTLESPANLIKTLSNELSQMATALGNLFVGAFQKALQYATAIVIVIKEIARALANVLGINISDYNTGIASTADAFEDEADAIGNATGKAAKLKKQLQLLSFDEVHNINSPQDSKGSGGGGAVGGINQALLDSLKGYENGLDKVKMKAQSIADSIMEWLGFTKEIDPLTGKVSWKYQGLGTTLKNMYDSFMKLNPLTKAVVGYFAVLAGSKIINGVKSLVDLIGGSKLLKGLVGITSMSIGFDLIDNSMKRIVETGLSVVSVLEGIAGAALTIGGAALIGSTFGPLGTAIGVVVGTVTTLVHGIEALTNAKHQDNVIDKEKLEKIHEYNEALLEQYKTINDNYNMQVAQHGANELLLQELKGIVDENGNVQAGYEKRAEFIVSILNQAYGTEMTMIDGVIQGYGNEIKKVDELIEAKKRELYINMAQEKYDLALKERIKVTQNLKNAEDEYAKAKEHLEKKYGDVSKASYTEKMELDILRGEVEKNQKAFDLNAEAINNYSGIVTATAENDAEAVEYWSNRIERQYAESTDGIETTMSDYVEFATRMRDKDLQDAKDKNGKITQDDIDSANRKYSEVTGMLLNEKNYVRGLTPEYIKAWGELSKGSEEVFLENLKKLPPEIQRDVVNGMYAQGYNISSELQRGLNQNGVTIQIDANTYNAVNKINSLISQLGENNWLTQTAGFALKRIRLYATGGFPEEGPFFMNRGEIAGKFSNGKSVVANNQQITEGIKQAVMQGMSVALANSNTGGGEWHFTIEEGIVAKKAINGINEITKTTGESPLYM